MQISSSTSSYKSNYDTSTSSSPSPTTGAISETATGTETPSSVKQFACGALGLDNPDTQSGNVNEFYTAGKWVAAAVTIGRLVSLFV
jgi:hypothetical protein